MSGEREPVADTKRLVLCPYCDQAIAELSQTGRLKPIGADLMFDERLRPVLVCPKCQRHTRIGKPKAA